MHPADTDLDALLASKEQEWKELQAQRTRLMEKALQDATGQLKEEREKFRQLSEDFMHNLRVLEERDRDLECYDATFARLKSVESMKQAESSELRIQVDKLQEAVVTESRKREELQRQYQQRVKEHALELEKIHGVKNGAIQQHREEYEKLKRELERKIHEVEGELALQKQELMVEFDSEMRRREHEFTLKMDEMSNVVLAHELKVKLLSKEVEVHRSAQAEAFEALQAAEKNTHQMEKTIKRKEWEVKDVSVVKDARIKELEDKLRLMELSCKKEEELFNKKHQDLDRFAREKESQLETIKETHAEQIREMENKHRELQMNLETLEMEKRRMEWNTSDTLKEKQEQIEKLRNELDLVKSGWDSQIAEESKRTVAKDMQIQSLTDQETKLKAELVRYKKDVDRYKRQVSLALEREKGLEQAKVQADLDWQKRYEDAERNLYLKNEELIQGLTAAKDEIAAKLQATEQELKNADLVVKGVTLERDHLLSVIRRQSAKTPGGSQGPDLTEAKVFLSDEIQKLQQENGSLHNIITMMKKEMEELREQFLANPPSGQSQKDNKVPPKVHGSGDILIPEYVTSLEEEVQQLKRKCREQEEQLEEAVKAATKVPAPLPGLPVAPENAFLQNHICTLNETIGGLRAEKVSTSAVLRKHEARVVHLESMLSQVTQQARQKQVEYDQLQFEMRNQAKHKNSEIAGLRERVANLELELTETRKEAEEYFKGNLQRNLEAVALGNEVSALKLDIASRTAPVLVDQNELVKQLQEENFRLRQRLTGTDPKTETSLFETHSVQMLKAKLKQSARCISQLTRDKQQLIAIGNKLRAELAEAGLYGYESTSTTAPALPQASKQLEQDTQNRLKALEDLQYQLTHQELQYAQRENYKRPIRPHPASLEKHDRSSQSFQTFTRKDHRPENDTENMPPELNQSQRSRLLSSQEFAGSSGLEDIWLMLNSSSNLSACTPRDEISKRNKIEETCLLKNEESGGHVLVQGRKAELLGKEKAGKSKAESSFKQKQPKKTAKIRNYNIKE
ncbi:coiled-coil domain-containing protein 57 isoform X2 [Polypterus senegalus]|uniref:coiled-coil domain-containing protein 57 isoform X2 n=1 Tax=Polypterus senegalus TaxID=55291 RepID=UPI001963FF14|nr:coiled-coil domain-containing protein 57 isoform X2 [Polypterus senegalus]